MILLCFLSGFVLVLTISYSSQANNVTLIDKPTRTFEIDYETDQFLLDGKPFRYISGSFHYFRAPAIYWEDRLKKMRAAGLNAIETYVEWSQHEPSPGVYDFNGDLDLIHFIKLAQKLDLLVILRPGPYICAERDLGGYPAWLFTLHRNIKLRTSDPAHTTAVSKWLDVLMPKIVPLLYGNGGPIIMVQVENEYGSYFACDTNYTIWLRDVLQSYVQNAALLFTTDGAGDGYLKCGAIPGVFITVDFGVKANISNSFAPIKRAGQSRGPLVNSEYYTGWLTHWNENYQSVSTENVVKTLRDILNYGNNTSVNFYMFYGGTNYGFTSGANCDSKIGFQPQLTSYDYDAPITEAGDLTEKYYAIKDVIKQYLHVPEIEVQRYSPKGSYGIVKLKPKVSLLNFSNSVPAIRNKYPLSFEDINHHSGFVLYKTVLTGKLADPSMLYVPGLRDRAIVMVDESPVGILSRFRNIFSIPLQVSAGQTLSLLVENEGHINYGSYINDTKGIVCHVLLNGQPLLFWDMIKIPLNNISKIEDIGLDSCAPSFSSQPGFYSGTFQLQNNTDLLDTYLNLEGWGKGVAFVNGFNLGRYWVNTGSQVTLYVPSNLLKVYPDHNKLTILELEHRNRASTAIFQDVPIINSTVPNLGSYNSQCQLPCRKIME